MIALTWFVAACTVATVVWAVAVIHLGVLHEVHHFEIGAVLACLPYGAHHWVALVGLALMADDAWQHSWQALGYPGYRSPVHLLYRLARNAVVGVLVWYGYGKLAREMERRLGL